jgi:23S rRNA (pseudouridine1915-N3)-methyltransferase
LARELRIAWAGRHRRDSWEALCDVYRSRIQRHVRVLDCPVRVRKNRDDRARLREEGDALLGIARDDSWIVALDRRGRMMSSLELAKWLQRKIDSWNGDIVFLLGSDLGLDTAVLAQARTRLSLGPLTLPHELARLVLYEQLYRSVGIAAGIKYHREPL